MIDQHKIWNYYQDNGVNAFANATTRLKYLAAKAASEFRTGQEPSVLNIGIGNGWLEKRCSSLGWKVHAVDPTPVAVARLLNEGLNAKVGTIESIPYDSLAFDACFCSEVLEHLSPAETAKGLQEIRRVLKNGGRIIGTVPYEENLELNVAVCPDCGKVFHRWGHQQSFVKSKLQQILTAANFSDIEVYVRAFPDFERKGVRQKTKSVVRWVLGALGSAIAQPCFVFVAERRDQS